MSSEGGTATETRERASDERSEELACAESVDMDLITQCQDGVEELVLLMQSSFDALYDDATFLPLSAEDYPILHAPPGKTKEAQEDDHINSVGALLNLAKKLNALLGRVPEVTEEEASEDNFKQQILVLEQELKESRAAHKAAWDEACPCLCVRAEK